MESGRTRHRSSSEVSCMITKAGMPCFFAVSLRHMRRYARRSSSAAVSGCATNVFRFCGTPSSNFAAGFPLWRLAEVGADLQMPASLPFNKLADLVVTLPRALFLQRISDLIDEVCQQSYIALLPEQDAVGGQAIPAGAAGFLVILFHG